MCSIYYLKKIWGSRGLSIQTKVKLQQQCQVCAPLWVGVLANHNSNNEAGADYGQQMVTDNSTNQVAGQSQQHQTLGNDQPAANILETR